ncbi:hypothetical protein PF011_g31771, partial [Phytophthora fragariae]
IGDEGDDVSFDQVMENVSAGAADAHNRAVVAVPFVHERGARGGRGGRGGRRGRTVRGAARTASPAGGDASIVVVADDDMADADGAAGQAGVAVPAVRVSGVRGGRSVRGGRGGRTVRGAASAASPAGGDVSIVVVADDVMVNAEGEADQASVAVPGVSTRCTWGLRRSDSSTRGSSNRSWCTW